MKCQCNYGWVQSIIYQVFQEQAADATKHHEIRFQEASLLSKVLVASGEAIWGKIYNGS